jgi:hypothetical protein
MNSAYGGSTPLGRWRSDGASRLKSMRQAPASRESIGRRLAAPAALGNVYAREDR